MQIKPGMEKISNSKMLTGMFGAYSKFTINVKLLIALTFAGGIGGGMTWFMLTLYMQSVGFSFENIGWIGGIGGIATTLTYLITPAVANSFGKKNTLYAGYFLGILSAVILLIKVDLVLYIISSIVGGIGSALVGPTYITVLSNMADRKIGIYVFSFQSFSQQIGMSIGTIMGGVLPAGLTHLSGNVIIAFWWSIVLAVLINTLQIVFLFFTNVENGIKLHGFSLKMKDRIKITKFGITNMFIGLGAGFVIPWFPLFFTNKFFLSQYPDFNTAYANALPLVSLIMTISSIIMSFSFLVAPFFAERFGQVKLIVGSQLLSVLFLFLIPFAPAFLFAGTLYIIRTILMMFSSPIATAFMMSAVDPEDKTNANSITMFAWNAAWSVSYFSSGWIWAMSPDYLLPFALCSVFYITSSVLYFVFFINIERKEKIAEKTKRKE